MTKVLSGTALAEARRNEVRGEAEAFALRFGRRIGLAVMLVGDDPASRIYVRNKLRETASCGMVSFEHRLADDVAEAELLAIIHELNRDEAVDGILVQLPLPRQINSARVIESIDPGKDVDGFHPVNSGLLAVGKPALVPCTPLGCMHLIGSAQANLAGLEAVVVGRSNIVGKPMAALLLAAGCTTTVAHSQTRDLPAVCRRADILVAAVGRPQLIRGEWIKTGAIVIDVGINRVPIGDSFRLVGDVAYEEVAPRAAAITPVPGGVGPMTIAMLLSNTLEAARRRLS